MGLYEERPVATIKWQTDGLELQSIRATLIKC